ncbi:MAG: hypothetical protein JMDDDDMK_02534 [Acidobacteria bacterium]|nr:hypothetical protein [Acidobacteriota bacterium]
MRSKSIVTLIAIIGLGVTLGVGGCRHRSDEARAQEGVESANVAPSDVKADAKAAKPEEKTGSSDSNKSETNSIVDKNGEGIDFAEREELRRSYTLKPGAEVIVSGINGRVDIETADTDHAELLIVRSARKREDLRFRKINIEHDPVELRIRVEEDRRSIFSAFGSRPDGRQRVMLKLPRKVQIETDGVSGEVAIGEIDGPVNVRGVRGKVSVAQATGGASFRGINGNIDATIAGFSGDGIDLSGLNGNTTLRFIGEVNADVQARGHNGKVESDLPNLKESKDENRYGRYEARIGAGGPQIEIRGVNGNVYLMKSESPDTGSAKTVVTKTSAKKEAVTESRLKEYR